MIFLVYVDNEIDNHELLKQSAALTCKKFNFFERRTYGRSLEESKRGKIFTTKDSMRPISHLQSNETLYVVGHGDREKTLLSGLSPLELADLLQSHGLNLHTKYLKIHLVCCHSGHKKSGLHLSFAEQLYLILLGTINPLDKHHMEKEGSLLRMKAPKNLIGFRPQDGIAIGIKPKDYEEYQQTKAQSPTQLDEWLKEHVTALSCSDFQLI